MTMMIKITDDAAIAAALADTNGKAQTHTYTSALQIRAIARDAENRLEQLGIPKKSRTGATVAAMSGDKLPSAYKYVPIRTRITLARRATGWYLTSAIATTYYGTPGAKLTMTEAQENAAIEHLRRTAGLL